MYPLELVPEFRQSFLLRPSWIERRGVLQLCHYLSFPMKHRASYRMRRRSALYITLDQSRTSREIESDRERTRMLVKEGAMSKN